MTPSVDGLVGAGLLDVGARHVREREAARRAAARCARARGPAASASTPARSRRRAGRSPAAARRPSTSSAATRKARASVLEYWKRPVSVTRPTYSGVAIAGVSVTSEPRQQLAHHHRGARRAVVDDADVAEPRVVVVVVEVDHEVGALAHAGRAARCGRPSRSRPRAAASRCRRGRWSTRPSSSSQRYSRGRSASARTPTASRPPARRPRTAPTSEPRASPSGFSCVGHDDPRRSPQRGRRGVVRRVEQFSSLRIPGGLRIGGRRVDAACARRAAARCGCCARASRPGGTAAPASGAGASRR